MLVPNGVRYRGVPLYNHLTWTINESYLPRIKDVTHYTGCVSSNILYHSRSILKRLYHSMCEVSKFFVLSLKYIVGSLTLRGKL